MSDVNLQSLLTPKLILGYTGAAYDSSESAVKAVLRSPVVPARTKDGVRMERFMAVCLTQCVLFVVDHDEVRGAIASLEAPPRLPELPPLPFPSIAIEAADDVGWTSYWTDGAGSESTSVLDVCVIFEETRGKSWNVGMLGRRPVDGPQAFERLMSLFRISSDGEVVEYRQNDSGELEGRSITDDTTAAGYAQRFPLEVVHLITASGVSVASIPVPRQTRRQYTRKGLVHPNVYFVTIRGGTDDRKGKSDREYHCRWLVRGHWRNYQDGRRTWVKPYVKGPAGAPWRGRPVYVKEVA